MSVAKEKFTFIKCHSLTPSKLVLYNRVYNNLMYNDDGTRKKIVSRNKPSVKKAFHNFNISPNAYKNLRTKIEWLYHLSKNRHKVTYSGKHIYNYKMSFITLTLSSKQKIPTSDITNLMFDRFLTEVRQATGMQNYVWRLEFQDNGNVHYHIVTDSYIDYYFALKVWNRIQSNYGYVKDYQDKFSKISLMDYWNMYKANPKYDFKKVSKMYAKNKSINWTQPPSVDIKSVYSKSNISYYLSKYFSKKDKVSVKCNELDNEVNSKSLRLWFCSRSLSKLKSVSDFVENVREDYNSIVSCVRNIKRIVHKYCVVIYFDIKNSSHYIRQLLEKILKDYSISMGYVPSG